jgi:hypothetical protein
MTYTHAMSHILPHFGRAARAEDARNLIEPVPNQEQGDSPAFFTPCTHTILRHCRF